MNKARILCIDLDDTLSLTADTILEFAINFDKTKLNRSGILKQIDNCEDYYYFARMLEWNREQLISFFDTCYLDYLRKIKVKPDASLIINKIKNLGIEIYIVTSRRERENNEIKIITQEWLKQNSIFYDKLFLNVINKGELIKEINPTYFVDDSYKNCLDVTKVCKDTKTFLIETNFNNKIQTENVLKVKNLKELYEFIKGDVRNE